MSDNKIHTLGRIDQAIRGINNDGTDDGYIPPQSENGALERIEKSIKEIDIKGIKSGLPKVTNADNGKVLQVKNGKWGKGDEKLKAVGNEDFKLNYITYEQTDTLYLVTGGIEKGTRLNDSIESEAASEGIVTYYPTIIPTEENHEPWRAFHDDDEYGGWSTRYENEETSAFIQYKFETPAMVEYIECKFKYENLSDGDAQAIPIKIFVETSEDGTTWTRHERPLIDHDISPSYKPSISTSRYAGVYKAIRFVSINPMYVNNVACVSIGNIIFSGLATNNDFNARSVWYKGLCFGELNSVNGGQRTKTLLYDSNGLGTPYNTPTNLSDSIVNYDQLMIIISDEYDYSDEHGGPLYMASYLVDVDIVLEAIISWSGYSQRFVNMDFSGLTSFTNNGGAPGENSSYNPSVYKIYGIKY